MKCIYYKTEIGMTFKGDEHILPAALGGIRKLEKQVSDKANNYFSKLEMKFLRESGVSIFRSFEGPGSRGSLSKAESKTMKSNLHLMKKDAGASPELIYLSLGIPMLVPQISLDLKKKLAKFSIDKRLLKENNDGNVLIEKLGQKWKRSNFKYKHIVFYELEENQVILADYENNIYIATDVLINEEALELSIKFFKNLFNKEYNIIDSSSNEFQPEIRMKNSFTSDDYRVVAKILFNCLAEFMGNEYVLEDRFDPIREWILNGSGHIAHYIIDNVDQLTFIKNDIFPEKAHVAILQYVNSRLIGFVSFYGGALVVGITILENVISDFDFPIGYICDWKNRKDYSLIEWLDKRPF